MRVALVNPTWSFEGSIYFGCREPHLPLELGYAKALLEQDGHEAQIFDGNFTATALPELAGEVAAFAPAMTVVTTAPTYLFWRCAQPELRVPREFLVALGDSGGRTVAVGPHGSSTPATTLNKLGVDIVVRGECEEVVATLAGAEDLAKVPSIAYRKQGGAVVTGAPHTSGFVNLPALSWPAEWLRGHVHHHHRFDTVPAGPGAEVEASRGCPYSCTFCAKLDFRDKYRRRDLDLLMEEIDLLIAQGVTYIYFVDEIFLPQKPLLEALVSRPIQFGVQTRIDLWKPDMLELLGAAGCVSIEAGVESLTVEGREQLAKKCKMSTEELAERLIHARRYIPFVQANLIEMPQDEEDRINDWREQLRRESVWANDPVPLYPYPSSPDYRRMWGEPDAHAWERAHEYYLQQFNTFSDIQDHQPLPLTKLEAVCVPA
jgi:anaerobic magnesium-protoporphyrin IX monomethyl ester cyclase